MRFGYRTQTPMSINVSKEERRTLLDSREDQESRMSIYETFQSHELPEEVLHEKRKFF